MKDAPVPSAAAPDLALAPDMPRTGRDLGTLSEAERTSERARLGSSPAYMAGDPHAVELMREHIAFDLAQREAAERRPAPPPSPASLVVNELELGAFMPPAQAEAAVPQVRAWAGATGATQADIDDAIAHAKGWARKDEAARASTMAESEGMLRGAWGHSYDANVARIGRFLEARGAVQLAEDSGLASTATGMARLLAMAQRAGF